VPGIQVAAYANQLPMVQLRDTGGGLWKTPDPTRKPTPEEADARLISRPAKRLRVQVESGDTSHVLRALTDATSAIRTSLGESLSSIGQAERHAVTEVTTPSLDAFQAHARGADLYRQGFTARAIPFFRRDRSGPRLRDGVPAAWQ
jgi:hypothetical protein